MPAVINVGGPVAWGLIVLISAWAVRAGRALAGRRSSRKHFEENLLFVDPSAPQPRFLQRLSATAIRMLIETGALPCAVLELSDSSSSGNGSGAQAEGRGRSAGTGTAPATALRAAGISVAPGASPSTQLPQRIVPPELAGAVPCMPAAAWVRALSSHEAWRAELTRAAAAAAAAAAGASTGAAGGASILRSSYPSSAFGRDVTSCGGGAGGPLRPRLSLPPRLAHSFNSSAGAGCAGGALALLGNVSQGQSLSGGGVLSLPLEPQMPPLRELQIPQQEQSGVDLQSTHGSSRNGQEQRRQGEQSLALEEQDPETSGQGPAGPGAPANQTPSSELAGAALRDAGLRPQDTTSSSTSRPDLQQQQQQQGHGHLLVVSEAQASRQGQLPHAPSPSSSSPLLAAVGTNVFVPPGDVTQSPCTLNPQHNQPFIQAPPQQQLQSPLTAPRASAAGVPGLGGRFDGGGGAGAGSVGTATGGGVGRGEFSSVAAIAAAAAAAATAAAANMAALPYPPRHALLVILGRDERLLAAVTAAAAASGFGKVGTWCGQPEAFNATSLGGPRLPTVSRHALWLMLQLGPDPLFYVPSLVLDVRRPDERLSYGAIRGTVNVPADEMAAALALPPLDFRRRFGVSKPGPEDVVVLLSRSGRRAAWAAQLCVDAGLRSVFVYSEGVYGWRLEDRVKPYRAYDLGALPPDPEPFTPEEADEAAGLEELHSLGMPLRQGHRPSRFDITPGYPPPGPPATIVPAGGGPPAAFPQQMQFPYAHLQSHPYLQQQQQQPAGLTNVGLPPIPYTAAGPALAAGGSPGHPYARGVGPGPLGMLGRRL